VVRCASRKIEQVWIRSSFSGVSSGTSTAEEDILEAVDARELSVWVDALWETEARTERADDTRPGILSYIRRVDTLKSSRRYCR